MNRNQKAFLIYLVVAILAYWQISFFQNAVKWDMVDVYLPWRYFISECIANGQFPLWNPYQAYGYPIHADMRSIWPPEVWIVSLLGGYSIYTFHILFILYTSIAGVGMKLLSGYFLKDQRSAFLVGLIYMLSGYLTGHGQEMYTINSFAFIPIVLYQFLRFKDELSLKRAVYFLLFTFIVLTSAYQAHSFMLFYLLLVFCIALFIRWWRQGEVQKLKRFFIYLFGFTVIIIGLLLPLIVSASQVLPYVQRLNAGVDASTLSILAYTPQSMLSLVLPFAAVRNMDFFATDLSMTNLYFGIIGLALFLASLSIKGKSKDFRIIFIFGLICLIASFGDYTPFRKLLFDYVPFMNLFRGSAFFRLYALIGFVLSAGFVLQGIQNQQKGLMRIAQIMSILLLVGVVYAGSQIDWNAFTFLQSDLTYAEIMSSASSFMENVLVQGVFQLLVLGIFIWLLSKGRANVKNLTFLVLLDMMVAVQLNIHATSVSRFTPQSVDAYLQTLPKGFPVPENTLVSECTDVSVYNGPLWRNTNIFAKRISGDFFNSFKLDKTDLFIDSLSNLKDSVTQNYFVYLSDNVRPLSQLNAEPYQRNTLFVADSISKSTNRFKVTPDDKLIVNKFGPHEMEFITNTKHATVLTLMQTNYPGWTAFVDNQEVQIVESNSLFLSVPVEAGQHTTRFTYTNSTILKPFFVSVIFFLTLVGISLYSYGKSIRERAA